MSKMGFVITSRHHIHVRHTMDPRSSATAALATLTTLRGLIPRDLLRAFSNICIYLPARVYAAPREIPPVRPMCSGTTSKGTPCQNRACRGYEMCRIHYKQSQRMVTEIDAVVQCPRNTFKGERCKCKVFKGLDVCWRHAKKEGLIPGVPSECAICYEPFAVRDRTKTKCGHHFHTACLTTWAMTKGVAVWYRSKQVVRTPCPMCRGPFHLPLSPR